MNAVGNAAPPLFDIQSLPRKDETQSHSQSHSQSQSQSPPPAYSSIPARRIHYYPARGGGGRVVLDRPARASLVYAMADDRDGAASPISLRINTSIRIGSDNNIVCLADTPAEHANAVARAVVHAIRENSSGQCGIPMIDEEGRPRPINIAVDAGLTVDGAGNVVGAEDVAGEALRQRVQRGLRRSRRDDDDDDDGCESPAKRTREE